MIGSGLFVLILMSNCVLSLPVTSSQLENEDVKVMKCIIEALADVLSRPHPVPVSEDCLATLRADNRLVTILRHHNFLKELQEIAVHGGQERAQLRSGADTPAPTAQAPQRTDAAADRSMLEALGGPGERSLLAQKRRTGGGGEEKENNERLRDGVSQQDSDIAEEAQVKRENDESLGSHISQYVDEWNEDKPENREEEEEEEEEDYEEKRANSEEESMTKDRNGAGSDEKRDAPKYKSKVKKYDEEENNKRFAPFSRNQEEEEEEEKESEMKTGSRESLERATRRGNRMRLKKKTGEKETQQLNSQQEVPHHSKEVTEKEEEKKKRDPGRTPEEKELQMIAQRAPEERRVSEEEGSASRKLEESEIESLAAIESELENVAQKLHELRQG